MIWWLLRNATQMRLVIKLSERFSVAVSAETMERDAAYKSKEPYEKSNRILEVSTTIDIYLRNLQE